MDLTNIKLVITDVDGVLTDGGLYYTAEGEVMKRFHVHDGLGIKMLQSCGIQVAVISGGDHPLLRKRLEALKIQLVHLGKMEKRSACFDIMQQVGVTPEQTLLSAMIRLICLHLKCVAWQLPLKTPTIM